jgi:hypothetical protein
MVQQGLNIREEFKDRVKNFCSLNNIQWSDNIFESVTGGVIGSPDDIVKVVEYINKLEQDRSEFREKKGFWWRIWN